MDALALTTLHPADFTRTPWKNGGGVSIDIAAEYDAEAPAGTGGSLVWRLGRTTIASAGPFSDLTGYDRQQVVVAGRGLVLETPQGEIDLRLPFQPVAYDGGLAITSRLEDGPVEVVNLIADRSRTRIAITVITQGAAMPLEPGIHLVYAAAGPLAVALGEQALAVASDHALRVDAGRAATLHGECGRGLLASILRR